jgi:hypothetical protein
MTKREFGGREVGDDWSTREGRTKTVSPLLALLRLLHHALPSPSLLSRAPPAPSSSPLHSFEREVPSSSSCFASETRSRPTEAGLGTGLGQRACREVERPKRRLWLG